MPPRPPYWLMVLLFFAIAGCGLFSDTDSVTLANDADARSVDVGRDIALGSDLNQDIAPDGSVADSAVDMGAPIVIDPRTLFDLIRNEVCDYYARQDYHGSVFLGVGFRDQAGCETFFNIFLRNLVRMLVRDVEMGRAVLDEDVARALIVHVRTYDLDPRVFPIRDVGGLVTPLAAVGSSCSTPFACVTSALLPVTCYLVDAADCDGTCVESRRLCGGTLCAAGSFCFQGACRAADPDGAMCNGDATCINQCISGTCGTLLLGDDCTANPLDCGANSYCETTATPDRCGLIGILNDACTQDEGCTLGHYCDAMTSRCTEIGEGTACRAGSCSDGLVCVQSSAADMMERCYAPRSIGGYCDDDAHCTSSTYCNLNRCTASKSPGAQCREHRECESVCRYAQSDAPTGTCALFDWGRSEGQTCHVVVQRCGMGMECETTGGTVLSGVCAVQDRPQLGEACEGNRPFWCPPDSSCRGSVCQQMIDDGSSCSRGSDCRHGICRGVCIDRVAACLNP